MNIENSSFYKEFLAEKDEIMKHKWYQSEKIGYDIGFIPALIDWTLKFKSQWINSRRKFNNEN